jgi:hypothetical protein
MPAEDTGEEASADDLAELMALSGMSTPFAQSPTVSSLANDKICPDNLMLAVPVLEASYAERDPDEKCDRFMNALVQSSSMVRFRPFRGKVIITARASQEEGIPGLLCVEKGGLSVVGGAELDETFLSMPLQYAKINLVPDCDDKFQISVSGSHGLGIFVFVRDRSVRDQWLASLSAIPDMKIDGWRPSPAMARDCKVQRPLCLNGALPLVKWIMNPSHSCEKRVCFSPNVIISYLISENVCQRAPQQVLVAEERRKMLSSGSAIDTPIRLALPGSIAGAADTWCSLPS